MCLGYRGYVTLKGDWCYAAYLCPAKGPNQPVDRVSYDTLSKYRQTCITSSLIIRRAITITKRVNRQLARYGMDSP